MEPGGVREIPLSRGLVALVDAADFDWLSQWKWCVRSAESHYAVRRIYRASEPPLMLKMHNELLLPAPELVVDHINGNGLDNRRANLRACTPAQNTINRRSARSGLKGVVLRKWGAWEAKIGPSRDRTYLGCFATEEEAARAYDAAAKARYGEFARLNFPVEGLNRSPLTGGV